MIPALKLSYAANVDDTWFLGSGIYAKAEETDNLSEGMY
jgi:signal transduction histidine kinase